jgi:hypothetical protein
MLFVEHDRQPVSPFYHAVVYDGKPFWRQTGSFRPAYTLLRSVTLIMQRAVCHRFGFRSFLPGVEIFHPRFIELKKRAKEFGG